MSLSKIRHIDPVLTKLQQGYEQAGLIGHVIFQDVEVIKEGGQIPFHGKQALREYDTKRAIRAKSNRRNRDGVVYKTYLTEEHDIEDVIDYREKTESDFDLKKQAMEDNETILMTNKERLAADLATDPLNYAVGNTEALVGTDKISNQDSRPWELAEDAKEVVRKKTGKRPRGMFMSASTFSKMKVHDGMKGQLRTDKNKILTVEDMKQIFDVETLVVGDAIEASGSEDTFSDIWGDTWGFFMKEPSTSAKKQNFGYTLNKKGGCFVDSYDDGNGGKTEAIRNTKNYTTVIVNDEAAFLYTETI